MTYSDTVVSTSIKISRSLCGYVFPNKMSQKAAKEVTDLVSGVFLNSGSEIAKGFRLINLSELSGEDLMILSDKGLICNRSVISPEKAAVLINENETVSIGINEDDHICIHVVLPGFELERAYDIADRIETLLDHSLNFAFDEELGYLTQTIDDIGTGMKASVILHLPALEGANVTHNLPSRLRKLGLDIQGSHGEGHYSWGSMYRILNTISLGISEKDAIANLKSLVLQIISNERDQREREYRDIGTKDRIYRSLGVLKYACLISQMEATENLSRVRLGVALGILDSPSIEAIDKLLYDIRPSSVIKLTGCGEEREDCDEARPKLIQSIL